MGLVGLRASLTLLRELGADGVAEVVLGHTRYIREILRGKGYNLASSDDERISGITSFRRDDLDMAKILKDLEEARITASLRTSADGRRWVRISPHYYNTKAEVDAALDVV